MKMGKYAADPQSILNDFIHNLHACLPTDGLHSDDIVYRGVVGGMYYTVIRSSGYPVSLSRRERQILQLIVDGCTSKNIAHRLDISPCTVDTYIRRMFAKLGVGSRAELVAYALRYGLFRQELAG